MTGWITASGESQTLSTSNLAPENAPRGPQTETSSHMEVTFRNGEATLTHNPGQEYQADQGVNTSGGVLASARTEGGGVIVARSLKGTDQVTLPGGMSTSINAAVTIGYLQRNPDGSFSETPMATAAAAGGGGDGNGDNSDEGEDGPAQFSLGDDGEKVMTEITSSFQPGDTIRAMDEVLNFGEVSESTLARMASQAGLEPSEVADKLNTAHTAFYEAATSHMGALGVTNGDAFEAFVNENPRWYGELSKGARDLVMSNNTEGLDTVADAFLEQADRYMADDVMDALEDAGYGHKSNGKGGLLVVLNDGTEVPFQVAVRQKIITFSK